MGGATLEFQPIPGVVPFKDLNYGEWFVFEVSDGRWPKIYLKLVTRVMVIEDGGTPPYMQAPPFPNKPVHRVTPHITVTFDGGGDHT